MIEENRLTQEEVDQVLKSNAKIIGRERDEKEVLGYYAALNFIDELVKNKATITQKIIQKIHALVISSGKTNVKLSPYREGQNVIHEGGTNRIVYLPPEAQDVLKLMQELVDWLNNTKNKIPCPLRAAIAHYEFATIHPYYDGNGRTARLLATLVLHLCDYSLKGLYSLDEYYAKNLNAYYNAISVGPSNNYYEGRADADITPWLEYFCKGMIESFSKVKEKALKSQSRGEIDSSKKLRELDITQRKILNLFYEFKKISSNQIAEILQISPRSARNLATKWVREGFFEVTDPAKKTRRYKLKSEYEDLID